MGYFLSNELEMKKSNIGVQLMASGDCGPEKDKFKVKLDLMAKTAQCRCELPQEKLELEEGAS